MMPLRDAVNHLFNESFWDPFGLMGGDPFFNSFFSQERSARSVGPKLDIVENKNEFILEADVPGFDADDIQIDLDGQTLILKAEKEHSSQSEEDTVYLLRERGHSYWERRFSLPKHVNLEKIDCEMSEGQLRIVLPKLKESPLKRLKINKK